MANFGVYQCACGILLEGPVAVKHIHRCKQRNDVSTVAKACQTNKNKASLLYELVAEIQTCSDGGLSAKLIESLLGLLPPEKVQPPAESKTLMDEPEYIECVVCREPTTFVCLKFECGHAYCQNHMKCLYGKPQPRCPTCSYQLSSTEAENVNMLCAGEMEESKEEEDACRCMACSRPIDMSELVFLDCMHSICGSHIRSGFAADYARTNQVRCPVKGCQYSLCRQELEAVVGKEEMDRVDDERSMALINSQMVTCCKCKWKGSLEIGSVDLNYRDASGAIISAQAARHMAEFRLRCPACSESSCVDCGVSPYHEGYTCAQLREKQLAKHCRFCAEVVPAAVDCCQGQDCQERLRTCCKKVLPCRHNCPGVAGEERCMQCLQCPNDDISGRDLCVICYCEGLEAAPCVQLACGHILHYHCLNTSLEKRWNGPRITFKFAKCPSCNDWAIAPYLPELLEKVERYQQMYREITDKAMKRLQFEGEDKLPRLSDPEDNYFQQPEKYAMDRFCYYECFKCKNPYFGGKKDCQQQDEGKAYNPEELVCAKCAASVIEGAAECPTHGSEYIQFKCRFCCAFAVWFCWGTTHFCEPCHQLQVNGGNPAGKPKNQLPRCPGKEECPLKVDHPENGEEFGMGCAMCRDLRANLSDF